MSAYVRGMNRLRCTCSSLLRLRDQSDRLRWKIGGASSECKFSTLAWYPRVHRCTTTWHDPHRGRRFVTSIANYQDVTNETSVVYESSAKNSQENVYAHNLFLNSINYTETVMQPSTTFAHVTNEEVLGLLEQNWSTMTSNETLWAIKKLSYYIRCGEKSVDSHQFANALNMLDVSKMSDDDLMRMIRHLVPLREYLQQHDFYHFFYQRVDRQCIDRFIQLSNERMLLLCDMMYQTASRNNSQYIWYAIRKLGGKPNRLTPQQLVQVLFFLNVCRKPPINMYELEYRLEQCIDDLSINEVGIAALGFFKTGSRIRSNDVLNRIMKKTITEIESVDSVSIGAISKLIRYSMDLREIYMFAELIRVLIPHEPRFTLMSLLHVTHACAKIALYNEKFIDRMIKRFDSELKVARMKDIERFVLAFSTLNVDPSNKIYQNIMDELRNTWNTSRAWEISDYPRMVARILGYLAVIGVYSTDLIQRVMEPEYINKMSRGNYRFLTREYCVLDYSLRVEVPEYKGPFLNSIVCNFLENKYFNVYYNPSKTTQLNVLLHAVLQTCQDLFCTKSDISVVRLLPHYILPDIVFCLDERNQLVPSEKFLSQYRQSDIKYADKKSGKNVRWLAVVLAHHGLLIRNNNLPTGQLAMKIRQLSLIGYTPITITQVSWKKYKTSQEKCNYVKSLVFRDNMPSNT